MPARIALLLALVSLLAACGSTHASQSAVVPATPVAAKTRWVGTHGIEVAVPAAWRLNRGLCGTPLENTVLWNTGAINACLISQRPGISAVEFGGVLPGPKHPAPETIGGVRVFRRPLPVPSRAFGTHVVQLELPDRRISVTVLSPDRTLINTIVASLRAVRVDSNGCAARTPYGGYRLGSRPAPGTPLVPAGAMRVVACSYGARWIDRSNRLGTKEAARLTRALNSAPFGFSRPPTTSYLPSICAPTWHGSRIVARFEYAHRAPVVVTAHISGCSQLGASNGHWAVQMKSWVAPLVTASHYGGSFPDLDSLR